MLQRAVIPCEDCDRDHHHLPDRLGPQGLATAHALCLHCPTNAWRHTPQQLMPPAMSTATSKQFGLGRSINGFARRSNARVSLPHKTTYTPSPWQTVPSTPPRVLLIRLQASYHASRITQTGCREEAHMRTASSRTMWIQSSRVLALASWPTKPSPITPRTRQSLVSTSTDASGSANLAHSQMSVLSLGFAGCLNSHSLHVGRRTSSASSAGTAAPYATAGPSIRPVVTARPNITSSCATIT